MARLIVDVRDNISEVVALACVSAVIKRGRVSEGEHGKMYYTWVTSFDTSEGEVWVHQRQYRKNDCFVVYKNESKK